MTSKIAVLHIAPFIAQNPKLGGIPVAVREDCNGLRRAGHRVVVWSTPWGAPDGGSALNTDLDAELTTFATHWDFVGNLLNTPIVPELMVLDHRLISGFDIVHFHNYWNTYTPRIAKVCAETRTPLILQPRGSLVRSRQKEMAKGIFQLLFRRGIVKATATAIALSETERLQLERCGFARAQIVVIPNMISVPAQRLPGKPEARRLMGLPEQRSVILFLGRLHPAKGVENLVLAYSLLRRELPESCLVLAGPDEGMRNKLQRMITELGIRDVLFLGPLDQSKKWIALCAADVFCLPSRYEAFPNAVLEAAWAKVPIVLSTHVSLPYLEEVQAVAFAEPVPEELSSALENVLSDATLRSKLVANAHDWIRRHFTPEAIIPQLELTYESAIRSVG